MPGPFFDVFAGAFGATTALVVCGGFMALRYQRAKFRHSLMMTAMERGATLPATTPLWLASMRQGVSILVIGATLFLVGGAGVGHADKVPMPAGAMSAPVPPPEEPPALPSDAVKGPATDFGPRARHHPAPPPPEAPAMREWHQAQDTKRAGIIGVVSGLLLSGLGLVRVIFAFVERSYTRAAGLSI